MATFGYKHPKTILFYTTLLSCLKACYDKSSESLVSNINSFLLLKNELSLSFLKNEDNLMSTLRAALYL